MRRERGPCTVVSLFSHYRYCSRMLGLTMHSLVMGARTQVRAMLSRRVTTAEALMAARGPTVRSCYGLNPNGAKLNIGGTIRHRFERRHGES